MICIQKIYGFHGINRQNIEKSWYVTPVTNGRTNGGRRTEDGKWKIGQCSVGPETAKKQGPIEERRLLKSYFANIELNMSLNLWLFIQFLKHEWRCRLSLFQMLVTPTDSNQLTLENWQGGNWLPLDKINIQSLHRCPSTKIFFLCKV